MSMKPLEQAIKRRWSTALNSEIPVKGPFYMSVSTQRHIQSSIAAQSSRMVFDSSRFPRTFHGQH